LSKLPKTRQSDKIYSFSNPLLIWTMRIIDATLRLFIGAPEGADTVEPLKRLLIANGGALGDVLIATSILPHLRASFPGIEIGFLVGTWAKPIVANHPLIDMAQYIDSPVMNRSDTTALAKIWCFVASAYTGLREIRRAQYDAVVDLHYNLGNYVSILWLSGIPRRVGYKSGGFGPLLTETHDWKRAPLQPVALANAQLFQGLGLAVPSLELLRPLLPSVPLPNRQNVARLLGEHSLVAGEYVIIHVGSGAPSREWPNPSWKELISSITARAIHVVCTGTGAREQQFIQEICAGLKNVVNFCDAIAFPEYLEIVRLSALLIGVDSLSGHVAAAASVPSVQICPGIFALETWRPLNRRCKLLTHEVACSPCGRRGGCAHMTCLRDVTPAEVLSAAEEFLPTPQLGLESLSDLATGRYLARQDTPERDYRCMAPRAE
jgi:ADP-heptose:LPS heptosyltransferase